eukprot:scaffold9173_cov12-Prasinocladus_malaysianus.AAC.1
MNVVRRLLYSQWYAISCRHSHWKGKEKEWLNISAGGKKLDDDVCQLVTLIPAINVKGIIM